MKTLIIPICLALTIACAHRTDEQSIAIITAYHQQLGECGLPQKDLEAIKAAWGRIKRPCRLDAIVHVSSTEESLRFRKAMAEYDHPGDQDVTLRYLRALSTSYATEKVLEGK